MCPFKDKSQYNKFNSQINLAFWPPSPPCHETCAGLVKRE